MNGLLERQIPAGLVKQFLVESLIAVVGAFAAGHLTSEVVGATTLSETDKVGEAVTFESGFKGEFVANTIFHRVDGVGKVDTFGIFIIVLGDGFGPDRIAGGVEINFAAATGMYTQREGLKIGLVGVAVGEEKVKTVTKDAEGLSSQLTIVLLVGKAVERLCSTQVDECTAVECQHTSIVDCARSIVCASLNELLHGFELVFFVFLLPDEEVDTLVALVAKDRVHLVDFTC